MSGAGVRLEGSGKVLRAVQRLERATGNLTRPMREIGQAMVSLGQLQFRAQRSPYGEPWAPIQERSRRHRRNQGARGDAQALLDTGRLRGSLAYRADATSVRWGTAVEYGAIHQFGGAVGRYGGGRMPARPYLPIRDGRAELPEEYQAEVLDVLNRHLRRAMQ